MNRRDQVPPRWAKLKAAARDPAQPGSPISAIPIDVLALVLSFIAIYPRLRVVSRVCQRWHRAVVLSVEEFPYGFYAQDAMRVIPLFPHLTALCLYSRSDILLEFCTPTRLRKLDFNISCCGGDQCPMRFFSNLTTLTDISIPSLSTSCPHLDQLMANSQHSLTRLYCIHHEALKLHLPSLLELGIAYLKKESKPAGDAFLRQHASHLTSLKHSLAALPEMEFPKLRNLVVRDWKFPLTGAIDLVESWGGLPHESVGYRHGTIVPHFARIVVNSPELVSVSDFASLSTLTDLSLRLHRTRSTVTKVDGKVIELIQKLVLPHVKKLRLEFQSMRLQRTPKLPALPSLTDLEIDDIVLASAGMLSGLRRLRLWNFLDPSAAIKFADEHVTSRICSLEIVGIRLEHPNIDAPLRRLLNLLHRCDALGVDAARLVQASLVVNHDVKNESWNWMNVKCLLPRD